MKWFQSILALALTIGWIYFLSQPIRTAKSTIPALGTFLSPWQGFWHNARQPEVEFGTIAAPDLNQSASILWDKRLVPHIEASDFQDLYYLQGYTVASQRLWQMDMLARSAIGRLSEVLGTRTLERDRQQRKMGLLFAAENSVIGWQRDPEVYKNLQAYTRGVNHWIQQLNFKDFPIEYKLMGFRPEPWSELKTAAVTKYLAQSLCSREFDLEAVNTKKLLGDSLYEFLFPSYFKEQSPVITPDGQAWQYILADSIAQGDSRFFEKQAEMYRRTTELPPAGIGSNNWAVSAQKTKNGYPILCNDPHLRLTLPSIWFENHLKTKSVNAYGVSVPGIPGIIIGFNDSIAWGLTNVGMDVADWYQIKWLDSLHTQYELDGKATDTKFRYEKIGVKDQGIVLDTVRYTYWGPVMEDINTDAHHGLAYHWIAHEIPQKFEMIVFQLLMEAKNYQDYYRALEDYTFPAMNFAFASRSGDIAMTVNGKIPLKSKEQGRYIQDGSLSKNAWRGFIPYAHNPRMINPARGFVASANQHSTDPSYPYPYHGDFDVFRGRTVNQTLEKNSTITLEEMRAMQLSTYNLKAAENLPVMLGALDESKLKAHPLEFYRKMKAWDFRFTADALEPIGFTLWYRQMYRFIFDELYSSPDSNYVQYPKQILTATLLKEYPGHEIFDLKHTPQKEIARDIVEQAFLYAYDSIQKIPLADRTWAAFTKPKIQHLANLPGFSSENLQVGGSTESLNAIANGSGPSWRMVVELGDTIQSFVVYPGGQSGNPGSAYYDNMVDDWVRGNYYKVLFDPTEYSRASLGSQQFQKK
jgi:penicillin G amidase